MSQYFQNIIESNPALHNRIIQEREKDASKWSGLTDYDIYKEIERDLSDDLLSDELSPGNYKEKELKKHEDLGIFAQYLDRFSEYLPDWDVVHEGYNRSLTGKVYEVETGVKKFENIEDLNVFEDIASTILSFTMPLDIAIFGAGKFVGNKVQQRMYNNMLSRASIKAGSKLDGLTIGNQMKGAAAGGAFPLAMYEGALGNLQSTIDINAEKGEGEEWTSDDYWNVIYETGKGVIRGGVLGSLTSSSSAGFLGKKAKAMKGLENKGYWDKMKTLKMGEKALWGMASKPAQVVVEAGLFTLGGRGFDNLVNIAEGKDTHWDGMFQEWIESAGLFAGLKLKHKVFDKTSETVTESLDWLQARAKDPKWVKSMENALKEYESRTEKEADTKQAEDIKTSLRNEINSKNETVTDLVETLTDTQTELNKIRAALKKPKEKFEAEHKEQIKELLKMEDRIDVILKDLNKVQENSGNRSEVLEIQELKEKFEQVKEDFVSIKEQNVKEFNSIKNPIKEKERKAAELKSKFMIAEGSGANAHIDRAGQEIPLYKDGKLDKSITIEEIQTKINDIREAEGKRSEAGGKLEKRIEDANEHNEGKGLDLSKQLEADIAERRRDLSGQGDSALSQSVDYVDGVVNEGGKTKLKIKPKEPLKGSDNINAFQKSAIYIRNMIQNFFPEHIPKGGKGVSGDFVEMPTAVKQLKEINKFATYLASKKLNFNTMTVKDVRRYLSQNRTHKSAISNLFQSFKNAHRKLEGVFDETLHQYIMDPSGQMAALAKEITTSKQREYRIATKVGHVSIKRDGAGKIVGATLERQRKKSAIPKSVPFSKELATIMDRLVKKVSSKKSKVIKSLRNVWQAEDGHQLYQSDINTIVENVVGKVKGRSARHMRSLFGQWAQIMDLSPKLKKPITKNKELQKAFKKYDVSYYDVIDIFALTHRPTAKGLKYLQESYGLSKEQAKVFLEPIKKQFEKDIKDYLAGKKSSSWKSLFSKIEGADSKFSLVEVLDGLKDIKNSKSKTFEFSNVAHETKTIPFKRKYSKDTVEGLMRFMIENPSDLMEIAPPDPKRKKEFVQEGEIIKLTPRERIQRRIRLESEPEVLTEASIEYRAVENRLEKDGAFEGLTPLQRAKLIKKEMEDSSKVEQDINQFKKEDPHKKEKRDLNIDNIRLENRLKRAGVSQKDINGIREKAFGTKDYKENPLFTLEMFKDYQMLLEKEIESQQSPNKISEAIKNSYIPEGLAKEITKIINNSNDGNYMNLKGAKRQRFIEVLEQYDPFNVTDFSNPAEIKLKDSDSLHGLKDGLIGKTRQLVFSGSLILNKMVRTATGKLKKAVNDYHDFATNFQSIEEQVLGGQKAAYNRYLTAIKKIGPIGNYEASNNFGIWMNPVLMETLKKQVKNKNFSPKLREFYRNLYEKNKDYYENSINDKGSKEYKAKRLVKEAMDRQWNNFLSAWKYANRHIEGSAVYEKRLKEIKDLKQEFYVPQILTQKAREHIRTSKGTIDKVNNLVEKAIEKRAETNANKEAYRKKPALKKKKLKDKLLDPAYKSIYEKEIKKIKRNKVTVNDIQKASIRKVMAAYENGKLDVNTGHFMERGDVPKLFMEVKKKNGGTEIIETYEKSIFKTMTPYIITSSKFIATLRAAPEYVNKNFYLGGPGGRVGKNVQSALDLIKLKEGERGENYKYLENMRKELMGEGEKASAVLEAIGTTSANFGLSGFALPGIKNFILGQAQIIAQHDFGLYSTAFMRLANVTPWNRKRYLKAKKRAEERGAIGTVRREFGGGETMQWVQEGVYRFNWMNATEAFNRVVAIEVGRMQYMDVMSRILDPSTTKKQRKMGEEFLRRMGQFTDKDILEIKSGKILEATAEGREKFDTLLRKFESYVHKATQGGTGVLDVPAWMAGKHKHWFLFQRIATSVTTHIVKGVVKPAITFKNFSPLLKYAGASLSGGALYQMFKEWMFDEVSPVESENLLDEALFYLWRAEFLGMFGGISEAIPGLNINPYKDVPSTPDIMREFTPVVARNLYNLFDTAVNIYTGNKNVKKAVHDLGKNSVVLYGQFDKLYKRRLRTHSDTYKTMKNAYEYNRQYRKFLGEKQGFFLETGSARTAYYRDLKDALYFGTEEEIAKNYWLAYNYIVTELQGKDSGSTPWSRDKAAKKAIEASLEHLNPLSISDDIKGRSKSKKDQYLDWLDERDFDQRLKGKMRKTVDKAHKIYQKRKLIINNIATLDKYKNKYSAEILKY